MRGPTQTIEVCMDCLMFLANGDIPEDRPDLPDEIWGDMPEGWDITLGRLRDQEVCREIHQTNTECRWNPDLDQSWDDESWRVCTCEDWDEGWFSWSSCGSCGSRLGGNREYATVWENDQTEQENTQ